MKKNREWRPIRSCCKGWNRHCLVRKLSRLQRSINCRQKPNIQSNGPKTHSSIHHVIILPPLLSPSQIFPLQQIRWFHFVMAISVTASTIPSFNTTRISSSAKLSSSSSLQFPLRIRIATKKPLSSPSRRPPFLAPVKARKETFSSLGDLLDNSDKPVLVDFYATWCGPCQFMAPILNEVGAALKDKIRVVKIDTEKYPKIADTYRIEALPTFILFKDGKPHDRFEGALTKDQLVQRIEDSLSVKQ